MQQTPPGASIRHPQGMARRRRAMPMLAVSAGLALGAAACGVGAASPAPPASASASNGNISVGGTGPGGSGSSGPHTPGTFSLAFAKCMRAHGVPDFPDPNGRGGQLGPSSGIDPNAPQFQAALNGPCKSMAPPAWVASGKVTR